MNIEEMKLQYYHESLALAQRALISGLVISAVAYFVVISGEASPNYAVPFFNIVISSSRTFSIALMALFFLFGLITNYAVVKAGNIWVEIADREVAKYALKVPSVFLASIFIKACLYAIFFVVGTGLVKELLGIEGWKVSAAGSLLAGPYFLAINTGVLHKRSS